MLHSCWSWLHYIEAKGHLCCIASSSWLHYREGLHLCCIAAGLGFIILKSRAPPMLHSCWSWLHYIEAMDHLCCIAAGHGFIILEPSALPMYVRMLQSV